MYCAKCGMQNSDEATQCVNCGDVLTDVAAGQPVPVEAKTSGLAIASLVLGILTLFCSIITAIPAIICGIIALVKISKSNGQLKGNGFAIAGITVPAVLVLIIGPILAAIMMPAMTQVKKAAQRTICVANLNGLSTAMIVYMNDYDDEYPAQDQWCDLLMQEADVSAKSFQCPLDPEGTFSYAINENLYNLTPGQGDPQKFVAIFEADRGKNGTGGPDDVVLRHDEHGQLGCNIAFADGHVEFVTEDDIPNLQWTAE